MTDKHSENVKPSWFGESIGHYENGDTLVIDTIGLSTKNSYIDNYRTPHTEKLHVVERFKLAADGKTLERLVKVNDPDTFNEPLHMVQRWRKVANPLLETVCAENNEDHFEPEPVSDAAGRRSPISDSCGRAANRSDERALSPLFWSRLRLTATSAVRSAGNDVAIHERAQDTMPSRLPFAPAICALALSRLSAARSRLRHRRKRKRNLPTLLSSHISRWLSVGADWLDPPAGLRGPIKHRSRPIPTTAISTAPAR